MSFIGLLYIFFGALGQYLINYSRIIGLIMVPGSVLFIFLFYKDPRHHLWKWFAVSALINVIGLTYKSWYFFTIPALWNVFFGIVLFFFGRRAWDIEVFHERERRKRKTARARAELELTREEKQNARRKRTFFSFLSSMGKGFVCVFTALMLLNTFAPHIPLRFLRDHLYHTGNVVKADQKEEHLANGIRRVSDICYDTEAPNGFFDIFYTPRVLNDRPATVVYYHGGGFVWGDKSGGDPNARGVGERNSTLLQLVNAGCNVVSMNYALTPEYAYPSAIKQLNRGLRYLKEHADEWELNMDKVAFAGFSAGGNLEGVLANIQTNPLCAAVIGEEPVLTAGELKAVVFEGGLIDYHRFGETGDEYYDYLFYTMGRVYFGVNDLLHDKRMNNCNIMEYVTSDFPASFISDGNIGTFYRQAAELYEKLTELGVYAELNYYSQEEAGRLWHGFEEDGSEWSDLTLQKMVRFLRRTGVI